MPLIFRWPKKIAHGQVVSSLVELVDIFPTLLELIGFETKGMPFQGKSLAPALVANESLSPRRPVYLHRPYYDGTPIEGKPIEKILIKGEKFGIRVANWKYIEGGEEGPDELFDLSTDPTESNNVFELFPEKRDELASKLTRLRKAYQHVEMNVGEEGISTEDRERLKALGYLQ